MMRQIASRISRLVLLAVFSCPFHVPCYAEAEPPFRWVVPDGFDPSVPGMGLEQAEGIESTVIYDPKPCHADPVEGGKGVYESLQHGTYNHHPQFTLFGDYVIVSWTNGVRDENGPGQRLIARIGRFVDGGDSIDWGDDGNFVELAPAPMQARRRPVSDDADTITGAFVSASLRDHDGRLFVRGRIMVCDGWTDAIEYHLRPGNALQPPVPDDHYLLRQKRGTWDLFWFLFGFIQEWKLEDGRMTPASAMYVTHSNEKPKTLTVTPTVVKTLGAWNSPYAETKHFREAPKELVDASRGKVRDPRRRLLYKDGTRHLAANGKNGIAHRSEFKRPDGKLVVVTDNLKDPGTYCAAVRDSETDFYGPALKTNLFGDAMPVAGELPDGTAWIVGSDRVRCNTFITWSQDGKVFDKTKSLMYIRDKMLPGIAKPEYGGAQYFQALTHGDNIWIVYSIGKEKVGVTKIPFETLK